MPETAATAEHESSLSKGMSKEQRGIYLTEISPIYGVALDGGVHFTSLSPNAVRTRP